MKWFYNMLGLVFLETGRDVNINTFELKLFHQNIIIFVQNSN